MAMVKKTKRNISKFPRSINSATGGESKVMSIKDAFLGFLRSNLNV